MEAVVLEHHHECARGTARQRPRSALHLLNEALDNLLAHFITVAQHIRKHRPVLIALRHLRMRVALVRIVHTGVDPALERGEVRARADGLRAELAREEDVRERREVADVEERLVPEVDRLGVQEFWGDHAEGDEVPDLPAAHELGERGGAVWVGAGVEGRRGRGGEEGEGDWRALEDVQGELGVGEGLEADIVADDLGDDHEHRYK